jgi:hypothetical protein
MSYQIFAESIKVFFRNKTEVAARVRIFAFRNLIAEVQIQQDRISLGEN